MNSDEDTEINSSAKALALIQLGLEKKDFEGLERVKYSLFQFVRPQIFPFEMTANLQLFVEFFNEWRWFGYCGVQREDMLDVYERALPLIYRVLSHPVPDSITKLSHPERRKALVQELQNIEGYQQFIDFARARLEEILALPKYKGVDRSGAKFN